MSFAADEPVPTRRHFLEPGDPRDTSRSAHTRHRVQAVIGPRGTPPGTPGRHPQHPSRHEEAPPSADPWGSPWAAATTAAAATAAPKQEDVHALWRAPLTTAQWTTAVFETFNGSQQQSRGSIPSRASEPCSTAAATALVF